MSPGDRVYHPKFGISTVEPYLDFDGTHTRSDNLKATGSVYIRPDVVPEGYGLVLEVDIEALTILPEVICPKE